MTEEQSTLHSPDDASDVLTAMVELVSTWSSLSVQAQIAQHIGLEINESDVRLLHTIGRLGKVRPAGLADALHVSRPTMSKSLSRLESTGLTERRQAIDDRRATIISLTSTGQDAYKKLVNVGVDMVEHALTVVPEIRTHSESFIRFAQVLRETNSHHPDRSNT